MQIIVVQNPEKGTEKAKEILYEKVDKRTVLFLSGGNTPQPLYHLLAKEKIIKPVAVGMIDERYGKHMHESSNERMIREAGFLDYLKKHAIPFYPMLRDGLSLEETAREYDQVTRDLFFKFPRSIAVMGLGKDGHTASIIPNRKGFTNPMFEEGRQHQFVGELNDQKSDYKERVGMTFAGLALIDYFIVLAFGKEKKKALKEMFSGGYPEELPARFFPQEASEKTVVITDQKM